MHAVQTTTRWCQDAGAANQCSRSIFGMLDRRHNKKTVSDHMGAISNTEDAALTSLVLLSWLGQEGASRVVRAHGATEARLA